MNAQLPDPPDCDAALAVLHQWLDGVAVSLPPEVGAHLTTCSDCRGRFAASGQLSAALVRTEALPPAPPLLTERIVASVLADARRRRMSRWAYVGAGLAAATTLAVWLARPGGVVPTPGPTPAPELVEKPGESGPNIRNEFAEAGEAVAALTRRTATDVVGAGRQLVPAIQPPPWPPDLEPASRPFEQAGAALADGFEPVATSARRAARLVWRELAVDDDKK